MKALKTIVGVVAALAYTTLIFLVLDLIVYGPY